MIPGLGDRDRRHSRLLNVVDRCSLRRPGGAPILDIAKHLSRGPLTEPVATGAVSR
jgi:hypothetical protein